MKVRHKNQHSLLPIFEYTYNIQTTQLKGCAIFSKTLYVREFPSRVLISLISPIFSTPDDCTQFVHETNAGRVK